MFDEEPSVLSRGEHRVVRSFRRTYDDDFFTQHLNDFIGDSKLAEQLQELSKFFRGEVPALTKADEEPNWVCKALPALITKLKKSPTAMDKRVYKDVEARLKNLDKLVSQLSLADEESERVKISRSLSAPF